MTFFCWKFTNKSQPLFRPPCDRGITLITTLLMLLVLASFAVTIQQQTLATARVMGHLIRGHQAEFDRQSARTRLLPTIGSSLLAQGAEESGFLPLDGTLTNVEIGGKKMSVRVQDVSSIPDLFGTSVTVFEALFPGYPELSASSVAAFRNQTDPGEIFEVNQALVGLGLGAEAREELQRMLTISSGSANLNVTNLPLQLDSLVGQVPRVYLMQSAAREVTLKIWPIGNK